MGMLIQAACSYIPLSLGILRAHQGEYIFPVVGSDKEIALRENAYFYFHLQPVKNIMPTASF